MATTQKQKRTTPADVIRRQHATLGEAITLLQADLDKMTGEISPDSESWAEVAKFAHVADLANRIIEEYAFYRAIDELGDSLPVRQDFASDF